MNMPRFSAEASLYKTSELGFRTNESARQFESDNGSLVYPAFWRPPSCAVICPPCEAVGGICIHVRGGCLCA